MLPASWRPGIVQQAVQVFCEPADFLQQFPASRLLNGEQDPSELRQGKQTEALLVIDRHHFQGGSEQIQDAGAGQPIQPLALAQQQVGLQQSVGQQDKQHLFTTSEKAQECMRVRSQKHLYCRWRSSMAVRNS